MREYGDIYYFNKICKIGGIETFFYQLAKKYKSRDLTIIYKSADYKQLERLKKYVRCVRYTGEKIKCNTAFFNFNTDIIDNVDAKQYCLVVHGDYRMLNGKPPYNEKITKYYGVSDACSESYTELTGIPCETTYNPISKEEYKPLIKLCSACRLDDPVKGATRTKELIKKLDEYSTASGIPYIWTIFTNTIKTDDITSDNVVFMKPTINIMPYMLDADYVVQLSDNFEGYNYTINESLINGIPIVATPCNVYKELGINEEMAIYLDFDMKNINDVVEKIFKQQKKMKFKYEPPKDNWDNILTKNKTTYDYEMEKQMKVLVKTTTQFYDVDGKKTRNIDEEFEITKERADYLNGENPLNLCVIKILKEIPEETNKEEIKKTKKSTKTKKTTK